MNLVLALCFIIADYVSGLLKAIYKKNVSSKKMRAGLWHKVGELMAICLCYAIDYTAIYININIPFGVHKLAMVYIICMEILSIAENICAINPRLKTLLDKITKNKEV